jgi:hypothetical protein
MARVEGDKVEKLARMQHEIFRRMVHDGSLSPEKVLKALKELLGNKTVNVNGRGWDEMVKACGCDVIFIDPTFDPEKHLPPLPEDQQGETEAILRKQNIATTDFGWLKILDENECGKNKFAHPLIVLALGETDPDEQRENPLFANWRDSAGSGRWWYICLQENEGKRHLVVGPCILNGGQSICHRAVAVAK